MSSLYDILSVPKNASIDDIKKAYRQLSLKHHPDKNNGASSTQYLEIQRAYQILSDPQKKAFYDRTGQDPDKTQTGGMPADFDIFSQMFGGGLFGSFFRQQEEYIPIPCSYDDILYGASKSIRHTPNSRQTCTACTQRHGGMIIRNTSCSVCRGTGYINREDARETVYTINVLPKTVPGTVIKQGTQSFKVTVTNSENFFLRGCDILHPMNITVYEALLGKSWTVSYGRDTIPCQFTKPIKPYTNGTEPQKGQNGVLCIDGAGVFNSYGKRGDLLILLTVAFPDELTDSEREFLIRARNSDD